jgi:hypothetical protein
MAKDVPEDLYISTIIWKENYRFDSSTALQALFGIAILGLRSHTVTALSSVAPVSGLGTRHDNGIPKTPPLLPAREIVTERARAIPVGEGLVRWLYGSRTAGRPAINQGGCGSADEWSLTEQAQKP